jgi:hypothetical protein
LSELNKLSKTSKMLLALLALALAGGFFCWGLVYSKVTLVPETIIHTVTKNVNRYKEIPTVEVIETLVEKKVIEEVPVIEYIEIEIEKEIPLELEEFESEEEMVEWLNTDKTNELPYIKDIFECENFARTLMKHSLEEGYYISFQVLKNYTRPKTKEFIEGPHAINSAIIGNYIYFIDPQSDDYWIAYKLENEP